MKILNRNCVKMNLLKIQQDLLNKKKLFFVNYAYDLVDPVYLQTQIMGIPYQIKKMNISVLFVIGILLNTCNVYKYKKEPKIYPNILLNIIKI